MIHLNQHFPTVLKKKNLCLHQHSPAGGKPWVQPLACKNAAEPLITSPSAAFFAQVQIAAFCVEFTHSLVLSRCSSKHSGLGKRAKAVGYTSNEPRRFFLWTQFGWPGSRTTAPLPTQLWWPGTSNECLGFWNLPFPWASFAQVILKPETGNTLGN